MIPEKLRKAAIYFTNNSDYWRPAVPPDRLPYRVGKLEPYLIDLTGRLDDGHFALVDAAGIPMVDLKGSTGRVYNLTRVCGYGLANFDRYMHNGDETCRHRFTAVATWLRDHAENDPRRGAVWPYRYNYGEGRAGRISGMSQGQAASVCVRMHVLTGELVWADLARQALRVFDLPLEEGGARSAHVALGVDWFEELIDPKPTHILNGHIYALTGVDDVARHLGDSAAQRLYSEGLSSLATALPSYDSGYWSYYDYPDHKKQYLASYSYHHMHCVLLAHLSARHPEVEVLASTRDRWVRYRDQLVCRLRAALQMAVQKLGGWDK